MKLEDLKSQEKLESALNQINMRYQGGIRRSNDIIEAIEEAHYKMKSENYLNELSVYFAVTDKEINEGEMIRINKEKEEREQATP